MAKLWCVVTCMGRLEAVKQTAPLLIQQEHCVYVLVDWSCPDKCGDWLLTNHRHAYVVRKPNEKYFSLGAARNLGAEAVPDDAWICFIDSDILVPPNFCEAALQMCQENTFLRVVSKFWGATGTCIVNKRDWLKAGKYEDFRAWGADDVAFYSALEFCGVTSVRLSAAPVDHIEHDTASRVCHYENKNIRLSDFISRKYHAERNLQMAEKGRILTQMERRALYQKFLDKYWTWMRRAKP